jgi:hypothetical protein
MLVDISYSAMASRLMGGWPKVSDVEIPWVICWPSTFSWN